MRLGSLGMQSQLIEFLGAALVMELTPGPNMSWLALLSVREGRRAGFQAVAGIALGLLLLGMLASLGVAELLASQPQLAFTLRWAGVLFMLYLAWEAWAKAPPSHNPREGRRFWRGVVVNLLNPKAAAVFTTIIPTFVGPARESLADMATFSVVYVLIATLVHAAIVIFAATFRPIVAHPARELMLRRAFAVLLAAVAIWMIAI